MFEESSIEFLAGAKAALGYVRDFVELLEERPWVSTADDAHDLALKIADCADRLGSSAVTQRCRKEAKELCELAKQLPAASEVRWTAAQARRIANLEAHAPLCPACRAKMRVRESKHGLFWGCRNFPSCFGKRSIERSEAESLW